MTAVQKTIFTIPKMDCPSEENLVRLKLDGLDGVRGLDFDIPNRQLVIFHFVVVVRGAIRILKLAR